MKKSFSEIEDGGRFRFQFMFFEKSRGTQAILVSDDKFEQKRAKFLPFRGGRVTFGGHIQVEPVDEALLIDSYKKGFNTDWPESKHPG